MYINVYSYTETVIFIYFVTKNKMSTDKIVVDKFSDHGIFSLEYNSSYFLTLKFTTAVLLSIYTKIFIVIPATNK